MTESITTDGQRYNTPREEIHLLESIEGEWTYTALNGGGLVVHGRGLSQRQAFKLAKRALRRIQEINSEISPQEGDRG